MSLKTLTMGGRLARAIARNARIRDELDRLLRQVAGS